MDQALQDKLETLLAPISADRPAGEDLGYSALFDQIREARRADDPALSQGDWAASVKVAEWSKVRQLCEEALRGQTKDLQLAVWYAEALTKQDGYVGAAFGLQLVLGLLQRYWETLYPELDPDDLDERVGKLEWMNVQLGQALRQVALTSPQQGGYDWYRWQESREVENLGLRDGDARERAISEGKLSGDAFDKSARDSGVAWFQKLVDGLAATRAAYGELDRAIDERFGYSAPSLAEVREALNACTEVVQRLFEQYGGGRPAAESVASGSTDAAVSHDAHQASAPVAAASTQFQSAGPINGRAEAIRQLREVARYFRSHEPHSPVALLAERAAKWAEMPLEDWLQTVIKDDSTLGQLKELLDIRRD